MNKETIYIEPSDDITDILSKLKASDKKIVALVPPKKPTVLLSSVNIKLIARTAKTEKKAVVLVSTDDALIKLAMAANLPVASSLKSRPVMPGEDPAPKSVSKPSKPEPEEPKKSEEPEEPEGPEELAPKEEKSEDAVVDEIEEAEQPGESEKSDKKPVKKSKKEKSTATGFKGFLQRNKLWVILGAVLALALVAFLVWALKFAPSVDLFVSVRTSSANFSENVIFSTNPADEKIENSTFALHEEKLEKDQVVKFTATGKKDMGESATGTLVVYFQGKDNFSFSIPNGTKFTFKGFEYTSTNDVILTWDGESDDGCETGSSFSKGCLKSAQVSIKAVAPGEDYNLTGQQVGWSATGFSSVSVYNYSDITGGTSKIVTVVQQSDVDLALDKMKSEEADNGKAELLGKISNTVMPIEASFKVETTDPKVEPAVGEEVKEGVTPQISTKTSYAIFTIDNVRIEEFIKQKANLEEGKRLYSIGEPFIEYFSKTDDKTYSAKLKTTYKAGPEISETEILDKIQGEKLGRIEPVLKDTFSGVSSVKIEKSYFWVNSVPSDPNKVRVELTIEE